MPGPEGAPVQQCTGATRLVPRVLGEDLPEVPFAVDQQVVEALALKRSHLSFRKRIRLG